jgi:ubiquinone/menaquinone biosynthesis C-methylase UbiE
MMLWAAFVAASDASSAEARPLFARVQARSAAISERKGAAELRTRMLAGLGGRVVEVGPGSGINFRHYPASVAEVIAVEPEPNLRALASDAERSVPVTVVDGRAEALPLADGAVDAAVACGLLCSVASQDAVLAELARVIGVGGELRFWEHVVSWRPRAAALQRALDASGAWARAMGGCRTSRDTAAAITRAGFEIEAIERFTFRPTVLDTPVAPKILGRARRA